MLTSRYQNAGKNYEYNIKMANRSFENAEKVKYLGATAAGHNLIHEEIKTRLNSGNVCYRSYAVA
jgi:hypothetical protein